MFQNTPIALMHHTSEQYNIPSPTLTEFIND